MTASSSTLAPDDVPLEPSKSAVVQPLLDTKAALQLRPDVATLLRPSDSEAGRRENLAQYAAQAYDSRNEALVTLIAQFLEDENFKTLCEDVEACWQRIGLER